MKYEPRSIDTRNVELTEELERLVELLASNTHDVWSQERISQGWTYGPQRCDVRKHHPDLIPYEELPESEKEYDRKMALEVLKAITVLGYRITKSA